MMNDRSGTPLKKAEAYEVASQDKGAPAVILVRPYLDEVRSHTDRTPCNRTGHLPRSGSNLKCLCPPGKSTRPS